VRRIFHVATPGPQFAQTDLKIQICADNDFYIFVLSEHNLLPCNLKLLPASFTGVRGKLPTIGTFFDVPVLSQRRACDGQTDRPTNITEWRVFAGEMCSTSTPRE